MPNTARSVVVVDQAQLRAEYFTLAVVMSLDERGVDRESLADVLREARGVLEDTQYEALNADIRRYVFGRRS